MVSISARWPASTRRPTPRADRSCTVLTKSARFRPSRSSFQTMSTSPFRKSSQTAVESRPVVVDTGGEVVVEVGRVIDARGPQGRARQRYPGRLLAPGEFVPPAVVDFIGRQFDLDGAEGRRADSTGDAKRLAWRAVTMNKEYILELIDVGIKSTAAILGVIYVCGFFTLSAHLNQYGIVGPGLVSMYYLTAGAPFVLFVLVYVLIGGRALLYAGPAFRVYENGLRKKGSSSRWSTVAAGLFLGANVLYAHCVAVAVFLQLTLFLPDTSWFGMVVAFPLAATALMDATQTRERRLGIVVEGVAKAMGSGFFFFAEAPVPEAFEALLVVGLLSAYVGMVGAGYRRWHLVDVDKLVYDVGFGLVFFFSAALMFGAMLYGDVDRRWGGGQSALVQIDLAQDISGIVDGVSEGPICGHLLLSSSPELYLKIAGDTVMVPRAAIRWMRFVTSDSSNVGEVQAERGEGVCGGDSEEEELGTSKEE